MQKVFKTNFSLIFVAVIALSNYTLAEYFQPLVAQLFRTNNFVITITAPWFLLAIFLVLTDIRNSGLKWESKLINQNRKRLLKYTALIAIGLGLFAITRITDYFNSVKYPILFFVFIPVIEEVIFRGYIYGKLQTLNKHVLLISSVLFALHHLQYHNYSLGLFVIFQLIYTLILGLLLGKIRELSGSIYLGIIVHILINYLSYVF